MKKNHSLLFCTIIVVSVFNTAITIGLNLVLKLILDCITGNNTTPLITACLYMVCFCIGSDITDALITILRNKYIFTKSMELRNKVFFSYFSQNMKTFLKAILVKKFPL